MTVAGARTSLGPVRPPHPLALLLPAVYHDDDFILRFAGALDSVIAPAEIALDSLPAYFDPRLAPSDFVDWLAEWVGADLDPDWTEEKKRDVVARMVGVYRRRGTAGGLRDHIALVFGVEPELEESGAVATSQVPVGAIPGEPQPRLVVRLRVPNPGQVDVRRLDALVASSKPAHVPHRVEVISS